MTIPYLFIPTQTFFSEAFGSQYTKGRTYTVRDGNTRLHEAVQQWAAEKKVQIKQRRSLSATMVGKGTVS